MLNYYQNCFKLNLYALDWTYRTGIHHVKMGKFSLIEGISWHMTEWMSISLSAVIN